MEKVILSGTDKGKTIQVKSMPIDDIKKLTRGEHILVHTGYFGRNRLSGIVHVKVNGKPKTWKTMPGDVNVPIKYGLYEYATIEYRDGAMVDDNLWVAQEIQSDSEKERRV